MAEACGGQKARRIKITVRCLMSGLPFVLPLPGTPGYSGERVGERGERHGETMSVRFAGPLATASRPGLAESGSVLCADRRESSAALFHAHLALLPALSPEYRGEGVS